MGIGSNYAFHNARAYVGDVNFNDLEERSRFYEQERRKGGERAKAAFQRLRQLGILDDRGELLRDELPEDMKPSADRDFGG